MTDKTSKDALSNGAVLLNLKKKLLQDGSDENLMSMLSCLRDSVVHVPFSEAGQGGGEKKRFRPEILRHPSGVSYLPIFSQSEQIPQEYRGRFSILPVPALQCLEMAHAMRSVQGLVLDAFTEPFVLPFRAADVMAKMPSLLEEK